MQKTSPAVAQASPDVRRDALDVLTTEYVRKCEEIGANVHLLAVRYQRDDGQEYYRTRNYTRSEQLLEILFTFILDTTPFDFASLRAALDTHPAFESLRLMVHQLNKATSEGKPN